MLIWFMTHPDLVISIFQQMPPCEESFRYLTFLAGVCKVWKECAYNTRSSKTWLLPFVTRGISYHNALKNAKGDLNLDAFTSGMMEYFSSQKMQESILKLMFEPVGKSSQEKLAINVRFKSTDPFSLLSNLIKICKRHNKSVSVFVATFKIVGILSLIDKQEDTTTRTNIIIDNNFFPFIIEGALLHKNTMNMSQCECLIKTLSFAPTGDVSTIRACIDYMWSFPASINIARDSLSVISENIFIDDEDMHMFMAQDNILSIIMHTTIVHISDNFVTRDSCQVLAYFMDFDNSMLETFVSADGVSLLANIIQHHNTIDKLCAVFDLIQTIACNSDYVGLLQDNGIIEFFMTNTAVLDLFISDSTTVSRFMGMLMYCISNRHAVGEVLLSYDILPIIERTIALHPDNLYLHGEVVNLLIEMNKVVNLNTQPFTDELLHIFGKNFIRFIDCAILTEPILDMFSIFIENVQNVFWPLINRKYLAHVHQAMILHVNHPGIQRAGSQVIMLMSAKELSQDVSKI